jgi:hypothetical protein
VGRLRRGQLRCFDFALAFDFVGASLLAKAAWQPTHLSLRPLDPCGSWLASDSALTSNQYLPNTRSFIEGASLLAKAAWQPTHLSLKPLDPCGSWLASDSALTSNQYLPNTRSFIVGASLLAKRPVPSTDALNQQMLREQARSH